MGCRAGPQHGRHWGMVPGWLQQLQQRGRCPPFTGTATVSVPFSVPPMRWVPQEWVGRHLTHKGAREYCLPGAWPPERHSFSQGKSIIRF